MERWRTGRRCLWSGWIRRGFCAGCEAAARCGCRSASVGVYGSGEVVDVVADDCEVLLVFFFVALHGCPLIPDEGKRLTFAGDFDLLPRKAMSHSAGLLRRIPIGEPLQSRAENSKLTLLLRILKVQIKSTVV